jgi:hypothetical protein
MKTRHAEKFGLALTILASIVVHAETGGTDKAPVTKGATPLVVYDLANTIAACKVNCSSLGVPDCRNQNEREIASLKVNNVSRLLVKGRASAEASTTYSNGSITVEFESTDGAVSEHVEAVIPARSSKNFSIDMPFSTKQDGNVTLYLRVSDWCTAVSKLTVQAFPE